MTYRAAIWTSDDHQRELVLSLPINADASDEELLAIGREFAALTGLVGGTITIGIWSE